MTTDKHIYLNLILFFALIASISLCTACNQQQDKLNEEDKNTIIETCVNAFNSYYVYPDIAFEMEENVMANFDAGIYDSISHVIELTKQLKKDFRSVSNDRHIWIDVLKNLPLKNSDVSDQDKIDELRKINFGFDKFEMLPGKIVYYG